MQHIRILAFWLAAYGAAAQSFSPAVPPLTLRISGARFHQGEAIPFALDLPRTDAKPDRMYTFGGFLLDPPSGCGLRTQPCFELQPRNGPRGYSPTKGGDLNDFVVSLKPGHYRLTGLFVLQVLKASGPLSRTFGYSEPRQYIVSTSAEFDVILATAEWQRRTVASAVKTLVEGDSEEPVQMREAAAHELRYIQTPQVWEAELDQLDKSEHELLMGLSRATDKKAVCAMMRSRLIQPRQYVSTGYFSVMASSCGLTAPPDDAAATLANHLNEKTPEFQPAALDTLIHYAADRIHNPNGHPIPTPPWLPGLRAEAIREWPQLPDFRRSQYLGEWEWSILRGPEMVPMLEATLDRSDLHDPELWRVAVRRLHEFAPAKAESRILADMLQPAGRSDDSALALLPSAATRNLTPKLIDALAAAQKGNGGDYRRIMDLLARYGDAAALPRIRTIFESQTDSCQPEMLAYFLRVDPPYADRVLHRQPWDMLAPAPACATHYFAVTARLYMSPELERFICAYLMHGNVQVKLAAAESLGKYGSAAAAAPLWDTLRYFHDYWKDRRELLKDHPEGEYLEVALRNSIARGAGWRATEADLRLIDTLCITERCRYETLNDLRNLEQPLSVQVEGDRSTVAQYYNITSLDALEKKLAQFPTGTTFRLRVWSATRDQVVERLQRFGLRKGFSFQLTS
ncbi:MAG TPA: hypothetical protein VG456_12530 [Candidatus Sulfopaludibacter sp.]|jgi:ribosomal protein L17|nr:hypothetical protein [Candidatus Sulfopaludibacter sp.]